MATVFDKLTLGGNTQFAKTSEPFGTVYVMSDVPSITLSGSDVMSESEAFSMGMVFELQMFGSDTMEHVTAQGPGNYVMGPSVTLSLFSSDTMEHIPTLPTYVMSDVPSLALSGSDSMSHTQGPSAPDEYIMAEVPVLALSGSDTMYYDTGFVTMQLSQAFVDLAPWKATEPSEATFDFRLIINPKRFTLEVDSDSELWVGGSGPLGGQVRVAAELVAGEDVYPIASFSPANNEATVFDNAYVDNTRYTQMMAALEAGPVGVRLSGFEALATRTVPLTLEGNASVTMQVSK